VLGGRRPDPSTDDDDHFEDGDDVDDAESRH
jgi:hypothetical protein